MRRHRRIRFCLWGGGPDHVQIGGRWDRAIQKAMEGAPAGSYAGWLD